MSPIEALKQNPSSECPQEVLQRQTLITVQYYSFDNQVHQGQIVVDKEVVEDIKDAFRFLLKEKFPLACTIPISHPKFRWDDNLSMLANNSSGFNYRVIVGTDRLSNHAYGRAIDLNPLLNPYIRDGITRPTGATYLSGAPGTILSDSKIVTFFRERGWIWGGDWEDRKDYQHFEKPLQNS